MKKLRLTKSGLTLVEVMIAMVILATVMLAVGRNILFLSKQSVDGTDRAFAGQKAIQMMEELRGLISNTNNASIGVLDDYDDGAVNNSILSTRREVTTPGDVLSDNARLKFSRRVSVISVPNDPLARRVYIRVFRTRDNLVLAETVSVIRTVTNQYAPSQVYDVYILALENVPGWWVSLSSMKPMFDNVIQDLQTRNPGLEWRVHWITRLSYGRDPYYSPYINDTVKTDTASPPSVYFYPGLMTKPSVGDFSYYVPSYFNGRVNIDGTPSNVTSYSIADQYNNAVRYPDEVSIYNSAVSAAASSGQATPEMSLRMLLEIMNSTTTLKNALLVNLHGELLPLPPIRNYSDAAKSPYLFPNVRVVTHPEKLQYSSGSAVKLRVYSYVTNPASWGDTSTLSTMTVLIPNLSLTAGQVSIRKVVGSTSTYAWQNAISGTDYSLTNPTTGSTLITIYKSPLRTPYNATGGGGLNSGKKLYGLEYIPCVVGTTTLFTEGLQDLAWNSNTRPKNTARWVITIAAGAIPDSAFTFETRIGSDYTVGYSTQPTNLSRSYAWVGINAPATEAYQFMGDPRHCPYSDVKAANGYNWYFSSVPSADYDGFTNATNGWGGSNNVDIPRFFQLYRSGLMNSAGIYSSMTGFSNYYTGLGGEMGYDSSNGFPSGLPIIGTPWNTASSSLANVDEITNNQSTSYVRLISNAANTWFGMHWLGELWPDAAYGYWEANGNLPVGPGGYYRAQYTSIPGALFSWTPQKRTGQPGASSFMNGNTTASGTNVFTHEYYDTNVANITAQGTTVGADFNFPLLSSLTAARPFTLSSNTSAAFPVEWGSATYTALRTQLSTLETYYEPTGYSADHDSSALVRVRLGAAGTAYANLVMNGLSPQTSFGSAQLSKLCAIDLVRGFMSLGAPAVATDRVPQLPLVTISSPTTTDTFVNPSTMTISWSKAWTRWDGALYTENYSAGYSEATAINYNVKFSNNNGKNWYFVQDGAAALNGVYDAGHAIASPYTWNCASQPEGSYIIQVEGYRALRSLHYSYHERQVYIHR